MATTFATKVIDIFKCDRTEVAKTIELTVNAVMCRQQPVGDAEAQKLPTREDGENPRHHLHLVLP